MVYHDHCILVASNIEDLNVVVIVYEEIGVRLQVLSMEL